MHSEITRKNDTLYVALSGDIVFADYSKFGAIMNGADHPHIQHVKIDLAAANFIDSAGLNMLLLIRAICTRQKKHLTLCRPSASVLKVFKVSEFEPLFAMEHDHAA